MTDPYGTFREADVFVSTITADAALAIIVGRDDDEYAVDPTKILPLRRAQIVRLDTVLPSRGGRTTREPTSALALLDNAACGPRRVRTRGRRADARIGRATYDLSP